ncbi:DUF1565 domain-containing protein [Corallococcus sp. M34]|uniref:DUF1565 domain-containing protein n=1 Tax=Citreicoccus inhibens TaxID=2849499 RepID=UPI001C2370AB|nr:DUF1565 domain-containing protein [Citreicoccus inhibens]MBU8894339.1 DUF1565 domain-containing protein [Citreicoccus inhibens]
MFRWFFVSVSLVLTACRGPGSASAGPLAEVGPQGEVWVDVAGPGTGDGSREHPLRSLAEALALPGRPRVHLAPGRYAGPLQVPDGARLTGGGAGTVVWAEDGAEALLRLEGGAELTGLEFQGGQWGLSLGTGSEVRLKEVRFSGQRQGAIHLTAGSLWVERSHFDAAEAQSANQHAEAQDEVRTEPRAEARSPRAEAREETRGGSRGDVRSSHVIARHAEAREKFQSTSQADEGETQRSGPRVEFQSRRQAASRVEVQDTAPAGLHVAAREVEQRGAQVSEGTPGFGMLRVDAQLELGVARRVAAGGMQLAAPLVEAEAGRRSDSQGSRPGTNIVGIDVEAREGTGSTTRLEVRESEFVGPYRRAVRLRGGGRARLQDVRFEGPETAVGQAGGRVDLEDAVAEGGRGPAFNVVEGALSLNRVRVLGHEYGLTSMRAKVEVHDFTSVRAARAGLGLSASEAVLDDVMVLSSGNLGGVQLTDSRVSIRGLRVDGAAEYGLVAVRGTLRLREGAVSRVHSAAGDTGEGLHLREVAADVAGLEVRDVEGACVWAAQAARVLLRDAVLRGCHQAGLSVDTEARLEANGVSVSGKGHALTAMNRGVLSVDGLRVEDPTEPLLWAECGSGTKVVLGRIHASNHEGAQVTCAESLRKDPPGSPHP